MATVGENALIKDIRSLCRRCEELEKTVAMLRGELEQERSGTHAVYKQGRALILEVLGKDSTAATGYNPPPDRDEAPWQAETNPGGYR